MKHTLPHALNSSTEGYSHYIKLYQQTSNQPAANLHIQYVGSIMSDDCVTGIMSVHSSLSFSVFLSTTQMHSVYIAAEFSSMSTCVVSNFTVWFQVVRVFHWKQLSLLLLLCITYANNLMGICISFHLANCYFTFWLMKNVLIRWGLVELK